jgi:hypothetical protein
MAANASPNPEDGYDSPDEVGGIRHVSLCDVDGNCSPFWHSELPAAVRTCRPACGRPGDPLSGRVCWSPGTGLGNSSSLPGQGTVRLRSPRWQVGQIAQHSRSVGADSPPSKGTDRRAFTQMEQFRRHYAAVSCRRRALTLPGSGRLAG